MEEAVLRPPRRHARPLFGLLAVIASLGLIWPAGIAAAIPSGASGASAAAAPEADSARTPAVRGLGAKSLDSARGRGPAEPLQTLNVDHANRGADAPKSDARPQGGASALVSVPATGSGAPPATSFGPWEGLDETDSGFEPPDPWIAVGPDDVVQTVNTHLRFTNREGAETEPVLDIFEFFDLGDFETSPGTPVEIDGIADPRWMYDAKHNRWLGIVLGWHCDTNGGTNDSMGFIFGALSTTDDPTGDYYHFYIRYNGFLPDYPMIGTSGDKITISANEFTLDNTTNCTAAGVHDAASMTTFDWAQMLTFPALPDFTYDFSFNHFSLRPAVSPQAVSNTIFVVGELLLPGVPGQTQSNVAYMRITGTNAGGGTSLSAPLDLSALGVADPFFDPPAPAQPPTAPRSLPGSSTGARRTRSGRTTS